MLTLLARQWLDARAVALQRNTHVRTLMWQWPSGEMVSWERSAPSRASMRPVSTIFPLLGYTVRRTILAPLPFSGIVCARSRPPQRQQAPHARPHARSCRYTRATAEDNSSILRDRVCTD